MGMVFQNFELFPHKTALGNVTIGPMTVMGLSREAAKKRALALLEKVVLADKAASYPSAIGRTAAARCHRQGPGHGAGGDAVR